MRAAFLVAVVGVPAVVFAALLRPPDEAADPGPPEAPSAEASDESPGGRALLRPSPRPAAPPVAAPTPPPDPAEADWTAALAERAAGRPKEAFALAKRARKTSPDFFRDPKRLALWKQMEAAAAAAESRLAALRLAALERLAGDPSGDRRLSREERDALDATFRRTAELIEQAQTAEERAALLRHARRFLLTPSLSGQDALARRLAGLSKQRRRSDAEEPLPADDEDEVEARRVEQLERLRQRDLVSLLDRIHAGLAWLALHQADDGHFSDGATHGRCQKLGHAACLPGRDDSQALAATSLALLAFLDFRDQDALGLFEPTLARGIAWLLGRQKPDGSFPGPGQTYSSAIALMALGQAAASTGREDVREAVRRGLAWFAAAQHAEGGFRYGVRQAGDLSATGWVAQAVAAAREAGVPAPPALVEGIGRFLTSVWIGDDRFGYLDARRESGSLGPVGMLTGLLVWTDTPSSTVASWRQALAENARSRPLYWLYYAVRVALAIDGGLNPALRDALLRLAARQADKGDAAGSFPPGVDSWFARGGATLQTAVVVLTMEHALFLR